MIKIDINGKIYPCRVTMGALVRYKKDCGKDVSEMDESDIEDLCRFLWCCVASACNADGETFGMGLEQFADSLSADSMKSFYASLPTEKKTTDGLTA